MQYPNRYANKLFFIRMVSIAPLSTSLILEAIIVFGYNATRTQFSTLDLRKSCWFIFDNIPIHYVIQFAQNGNRRDMGKNYKVIEILVLHFG